MDGCVVSINCWRTACATRLPDKTPAGTDTRAHLFVSRAHSCSIASLPSRTHARTHARARALARYSTARVAKMDRERSLEREASVVVATSTNGARAKMVEFAEFPGFSDGEPCDLPGRCRNPLSNQESACGHRWIGEGRRNPSVTCRCGSVLLSLSADVRPFW